MDGENVNGVEEKRVIKEVIFVDEAAGAEIYTG